MLSFCFSCRNWDSPTPSPTGKCVPPRFRGGGAHSLAGERGGKVPIRTRGHTLWYSVYMCTLWCTHVDNGSFRFFMWFSKGPLSMTVMQDVWRRWRRSPVRVGADGGGDRPGGATHHHWAQQHDQPGRDSGIIRQFWISSLLFLNLVQRFLAFLHDLLFSLAYKNIKNAYNPTVAYLTAALVGGRGRHLRKSCKWNTKKEKKITLYSPITLLICLWRKEF